MNTEKIKHNINYLLENKSISLATINELNQPHISYCPFIYHNNKIYIIISQMAKHYKNISNSNLVSALIIEDESKCTNIFFRKRLTLNLTLSKLNLNGEIIDIFIKEHSDIVQKLLQMDFSIFEFNIENANIVYGPANAFNLDSNLNLLNQIKDDFILSKFDYKGFKYFLFKQEHLGSFKHQYSNYEIELVTDKDKTNHINKHFEEDFNYKGSFDNTIIAIIKNE